jgi:hypothetical protein
MSIAHTATVANLKTNLSANQKRLLEMEGGRVREIEWRSQRRVT